MGLQIDQYFGTFLFLTWFCAAQREALANRRCSTAAASLCNKNIDYNALLHGARARGGAAPLDKFDP